MITTLLLVLAIEGLEPPASRAEICHARINAFIADQMNTTGRVAGPSWFIRDWWAGRLTEGLESDEARQAAVTASLAQRQTSEPELVRNETSDCIEDASPVAAP